MLLVIEGSLPGLNEYIEAERGNRFQGAKMKRVWGEKIMWQARRDLGRVKIPCPVVMHYTWYEKDRRRDMDNISAFGRKVIQDALVKGGWLPNDGWAQIAGFTDEFKVDKLRPRIEVCFEMTGGAETAGKSSGGKGTGQGGKTVQTRQER